MKITLLIVILTSISYSQNHYLSFEYDTPPTSSVYDGYTAISLIYHFAFLGDKIRIGGFAGYYTHNVKYSLFKINSNFNGPTENGLLYGLSLRIFPLDSALLGTSKVLPYLTFSYEKYDGLLKQSEMSRELSKFPEEYSKSYGLGVTYKLSAINIFFALAYESRESEFNKYYYDDLSHVTTSKLKVDLSSLLLNMGINFRL